jgi:excisionase family DNA binding protein
MIKKTFCTTREAAELLGVSVRTAQLWVENGLLSAWKTVGGHRRVSRDSVEQMLHKTTPLAKPAAPDIRLRILIVEDNEALLRLYQERLMQWSMSPKVTITGNKVEALFRLGHEVPDLLITDLAMPETNGFSMLRLLDAMPEKFSRMSIVVVSGLDADTIRQHGGIPEGVRLLPKPIPFDTLQEIAQNVWNRKLAACPGDAQCA